MAESKAVSPPAGLGREGRRLWRRITAQVAEDGARLDAREVAWLELAAREADELQRVEAALDGQPRTVRGAQGQLVSHPLIGEARRSRAAIAGWLGRLDLADPDAATASGRGSRTTSTQARSAAMFRHHGRGA